MTRKDKKIVSTTAIGIGRGGGAGGYITKINKIKIEFYYAVSLFFSPKYP